MSSQFSISESPECPSFPPPVSLVQYLERKSPWLGQLSRRSLILVELLTSFTSLQLCNHRTFWWSSLAKDTREYIAACPVCAQSKTSTTPPADLLHSLPVPGRPWSHIALDFVTGLPTSEDRRTACDCPRTPFALLLLKHNFSLKLPQMCHQ